jgi:hypothetical protein
MVQVSTEPDSQLNADQNALLVQICTYVNGVQASLDGASAAPDPIHILVQGGPGVGKSFFVRTLYDKLKQSDLKIRTCAPTGCAAMNLPDGQTNHSLFCLPIQQSRKKEKTCLPDLCGKAQMIFGQSFSDCLILIVDEISMADPLTIYKIDQRLRNVLNHYQPFGGLGVIFMGDFYQLPPVAGTSLPTAMVNHYFRGTVIEKTFLAEFQTGVELFQSFQLLTWNQQMRAVSDVVHTNMLNEIRVAETGPRIKSEHLAGLKRLSAEDFKNDEDWLIAPIVVAENFDREILNQKQCIRFGKYHGLPIYAWRHPIKPIDRCYLSDDILDEFYANHPDLATYFVQDGPAYLINQNIQTLKQLSNGTRVRFNQILRKGKPISSRVKPDASGVIWIDAPEYIAVELVDVNITTWPGINTDAFGGVFERGRPG